MDYTQIFHGLCEELLGLTDHVQKRECLKKMRDLLLTHLHQIEWTARQTTARSVTYGFAVWETRDNTRGRWSINAISVCFHHASIISACCVILLSRVQIASSGTSRRRSTRVGLRAFLFSKSIFLFKVNLKPVLNIAGYPFPHCFQQSPHLLSRDGFEYMRNNLNVKRIAKTLVSVRHRNPFGIVIR